MSKCVFDDLDVRCSWYDEQNRVVVDGWAGVVLGQGTKLYHGGGFTTANVQYPLGRDWFDTNNRLSTYQRKNLKQARGEKAKKLAEVDSGTPPIAFFGDLSIAKKYSKGSNGVGAFSVARDVRRQRRVVRRYRWYLRRCSRTWEAR